MGHSEAAAVETIRLELAGSATRAEIAGIWHEVATPTALWALIGERSTATLVHVIDRRSAVDAEAVGRLAGTVREAGVDGAVARIRYTGGALSRVHECADDALSMVTAPGSVLATPALFARMAARPAHAVWDTYWASDLHRVAYRRGRLLGSDEIVADVALPAPQSALLPIERAGDRPYDPGAPTVVIYGVFDASSALTFDPFSAAPGMNLRFLRQATPGRQSWFCRASALVVARALIGMVVPGELWRLASAGIPVHWFMDDDFFVLGEEYPGLAPFYKAENFVGVTEDLAGLLVSTRPLGRSLTETLSLPPGRAHVLPPRISPEWRRSEHNGERSGLGIIGSGFRGSGVGREVAPALKSLAGRCPIFVTETMRPHMDGLAVTFVDRQPDFLHFLHVWTQLPLAAVLHPPGETRNLANKADSLIMLSHLMGAVPIVAPEPAFEGWGEAEGVLKAAPGDWPATIARALDPYEGRALRDRLTAALAGERHMGTEADILLAALGNPPPVSRAIEVERLERLGRLGPPPIWNAPRPLAGAPPPTAEAASDPVRVAFETLPPAFTSGLNRVTGWHDATSPLPAVTVNGTPIPTFEIPKRARRQTTPDGASAFEAFVDCWRFAEPGDTLEISATSEDGASATHDVRFLPERRIGSVQPLTVFLHLPKTAGTTLRVALEEAEAAQSKGRLLTMYEESPHFRNHLLEGLSPRSLAEFDFLYGHLDTSIEETIARVDAGRRVNFVAVMREPRAFLLSYFFYGRPHMDTMRGHDLFSFLSTPNRVIDNLFCRLIVGRPVTKVDKAYLAEAKDMLWRRFLFVGATENMPLTMSRVGALTGYDLSPWIGWRTNITPAQAERDDVDLQRVADATEALVRYDEQLYAYARHLFL